MKSKTKSSFRDHAAELWSSVPGNVLREDMGVRPEYIGTVMYDPPLVGFGAADDPLFEVFKQPEVIGPWHKSPREWLPEAQTVISFFFPMSEAVRASNRAAKQGASGLWACARVEGQAYISAYIQAVAAWFQTQGDAACVPSADPRWQLLDAGKGITGYPEIRETTFGCSWSERHAAYVCGLGTFGLSKGLITAKGMAGRFGSVLVSAAFAPDARSYTGVDDSCTRCGACVGRCPAQAIDPVRGKDHMKCWRFVTASRETLAPRYGCGLCQTGVPCEAQNPAAANGCIRDGK